MTGRPIVVLGDVMTDVIARTSAPPVVGSDTAAEIVLRPGGSAANTAAWIGHLGGSATLIGCVGADAFGREAEIALRLHGVVARLAVTREAPSGACVILVDERGERTMFPDARANGHLRPADLPDGAFVSGGHLHLSGYALLRPAARPAALEALRRARSAAMTASVDPASAAPLAAVGARVFRDLVRGVDLMVVTLDEGEVLCGTRDPGRIAADLLRDHAEVVVKAGPRGATWHGPDGSHAHVAAVAPSSPVVDTTGAGDAFVAALLHARMRGEDANLALQRACSLAAVVVTHAGARPLSR